MPEPLPEHQKTQLIVRSPLSTEGFVSIYFSSPDGRLMSEEEWWNLKQLIELTNRVCVKQQSRARPEADEPTLAQSFLRGTASAKTFLSNLRGKENVRF